MAKKKPTRKKAALKSTKKMDPVKAFLIVTLVALVGGFSVWIINAQTISSYHKSIADCPKDPPAVLQACADKSAEAIVFRYYAGLLGRTPDTDGIKFWSKQLTTRKNSVERVAERMLASNESRNKEAPNATFLHILYVNIMGSSDYNQVEYTAYLKKLDEKKVTRNELIEEFAKKKKISTEKAKSLVMIDDVRFVTNLYERMLGRKWLTTNGSALQSQNSEVEYWVNQLKRPAGGTKPAKMTRAEVASAFARSNEAIAKHRTAFVNYINKQK